MAKAQLGKSRWNREIERGRTSLRRQWEQIESIRDKIGEIIAANDEAPDDEALAAARYVLEISQRLDRLCSEASELESVMGELWRIGAQSAVGDEDD
jgi:hypothetical protein